MLKKERTKLESYEKEDDLGGYKYDYLADKNVWNEDSRNDSIVVFAPRPQSLFESTSIFFNNHYGKFKGMIHFHKGSKTRSVHPFSDAAMNFPRRNNLNR